MTYVLLRSTAFVRETKKTLKKNPRLASSLKTTFQLLSTDPYTPSLKTHKLKGDLKSYWACSAGYNLRIIFRFVEHEGCEAILLASIGTHDEVY